MASTDKSPKERFAQLQKEKNGGPKAAGKVTTSTKFGTTAAKEPATITKESENSKVEAAKAKNDEKKIPEVKVKPESKKTEAEKTKVEQAKPVEAAKPTSSNPAGVPKPVEALKPAAINKAEAAKSTTSKPPESAKPLETTKLKEETKKAPAGKMDLDLDAEMKANAAKLADKSANSPASAKVEPGEPPKPAADAPATVADKPPEQPKPAVAIPNSTSALMANQAHTSTQAVAKHAAPSTIAASATQSALSSAAAAPHPTSAPTVAAQPKSAATSEASIPSAPVSQKPNDEFFTNIFYFSGMGSLIGSALAEGVYVPERNQRSALDAEEMEAAKERSRVKSEEVIVTARTQAQGLSTDFRHLQSLLDTLPTFTDTLNPQALDKRGIDQPIHGHRYFRQQQSESIAVSEGGSRRADPSGGVQVYPQTTADLYYQQQRQQEEESARQRDRQRQEEEEQRYRDTQRQQKEEARRRQLEAEQRAAALSTASGSSPHQNGRGSRGYDGDVAAQQAWQDKYSLREGAGRQRTPRRQQEEIDYNGREGGDVDTQGIKPWQLSHIRSLEAKGYHIIDHEGEITGGNWSSYQQQQQQQRAGSVGRPSPAPQHARPYYPPATGYNDTSLPYCDL